jgi:hypothetical protein
MQRWSEALLKQDGVEENGLRSLSLFEITFPFKFSSRCENKIETNIYGPQKNMKFCMAADWNIWDNFCIGYFDQRTTIFK